MVVFSGDIINQDGISKTTELHSLSELGIESINVNYEVTNTHENRNKINQNSSFTQTTIDAQGNTQSEVKSINDVYQNSITFKNIDDTNSTITA